MFNGDFSWPFQRVCCDLKISPGPRPRGIHHGLPMQAAASLDRKGPMALLQRLPDGEEVVVSWKGKTKREKTKKKKPAGWLGYIGDYMYYQYYPFI